MRTSDNNLIKTLNFGTFSGVTKNLQILNIINLPNHCRLRREWPAWRGSRASRAAQPALLPPAQVDKISRMTSQIWVPWCKELLQFMAFRAGPMSHPVLLLFMRVLSALANALPGQINSHEARGFTQQIHGS